MAWYPDAIARPIPPGSNDPAIIPVGLIYHVRAGLGDSLYPYFDGPSGGIESHWYIRFDGTIEQYRDTEREADANLDGNSWRGGDGRLYGLHSVETEGLEHGEWTDAQIASLKELTVWDAETHDWPLQLIPRWDGVGVGYHVMFGAPGPYTDVAKTCPGPDRVKQFHSIITPWLRSGRGEDAMDLSDRLKSYVLDGTESVQHALSTTRRDAFRLRRTLLYSGDSNQSSETAKRVGVRRIDNPRHPGSEESPEWDKPPAEQRRASWRWALERIWKNTWWTLVRTRRIEAKLDGFIDAQDERVQEAVAAALAEHDRRIVQVEVSIADDEDDETDS